MRGAWGQVAAVRKEVGLKARWFGEWRHGVRLKEVLQCTLRLRRRAVAAATREVHSTMQAPILCPLLEPKLCLREIHAIFVRP